MIRGLVLLLSGLFIGGCADGDDSAREALAAVQGGALLIDVRSPEEFAGGHLPGAINIPHGEIVAGMQALQTPKDAPVVLYCRSGNRSGIARQSLTQAGYSNLMNAGGYSRLKVTWDAGS